MHITSQQRQHIETIERVVRGDGFEPKLAIRPLADELDEFGDPDQPGFAKQREAAAEGAIIVHRDPSMNDQFEAGTGEHIIPDEGLIIRADGTAL